MKENINPISETQSIAPRPKLPVDFIGLSGKGNGTIPTPDSLAQNSSIAQVLLFARKVNASDVHLSSNNPVFFKIYGKLIAQTGDAFSDQKMQNIIAELLNSQQQNIFYSTGDFEFIYVIEGAGRFRVTLTRKSTGCDVTIRLIPQEILSFEESGMPESCLELTKWTQGMVLVTGPIGCGKTTTLSILCDVINQTRKEHIISIENPIEVVYEPKQCQITQRQIGLHTLDQEAALKAALREDPDIIVVSELRDIQTIQLAATAAETGHLVFGTMNTNDSAQTILRIVNSFAAEDKTLIQNMISESLRGIICQQLVPKKDGTGVVPAYEVLKVNPAISNLIRKGNVDQVLLFISTGAAEGMIPFDTSLMHLWRTGLIGFEEAFMRCVNKQEFEKYKPGVSG